MVCPSGSSSHTKLELHWASIFQVTDIRSLKDQSLEPTLFLVPHVSVCLPTFAPCVFLASSPAKRGIFFAFSMTVKVTF